MEEKNSEFITISKKEVYIRLRDVENNVTKLGTKVKYLTATNIALVGVIAASILIN